MKTINEILVFSLALFMTLFTAISTTMPLFQLGLAKFLIINVIFVASSFMYALRKTKKNTQIDTFINFSKSITKGNRVMKLRLFLVIALAIVPAVSLYMNNLVYSYFFMVDTLGVSPSFINFLQFLLVPVSIMLSIALIRDIWNLVGHILNYYQAGLKHFINNFKDNKRKTAISLFSIALGAYLGYWTTNISIMGIQLYQLTFSNAQMILPISDFIYFLLFITSFIMFAGTLNFVANNLDDMLSSKRSLPNKKDLLNIFCSLVRITISCIAAERRVSSFGFASLSALDNIMTYREKDNSNSDLRTKLNH